MCIIFVTSCDKAPEFVDVKKNFSSNRGAFDELASTTCKLGNKKQKFSYRIDSFRYHPNKIKEEYRNHKLDHLLKATGTYAIIYEKSVSGKCNLIIGYYVSGFAGSRISYNYRFQFETITPYEKEKHTFKIITKAKQKTHFDMFLDNGWYFSFTYS
jgi:hypothetical protein